MTTSLHTERSSKRLSIVKPVVALALVLVFTSADARRAEARVDVASVGSEGNAISASASVPSVSPVTLPIEVLGPDGYTVSVNVDVPSPGEVSTLYLQIHSPVYRDVSVNPGRGPKASVRLNGGPWVGITNATADVFDHEAEYGGLNGAYHTVRMTIPISALGTPQSGSNTLRFRFNGTDNHTLGFRVLDFNFLRSGGSEILPASAFTEDDPALWTPISNNPADINAGEELWRSAQLVDYPNGPSIQAACGDCHAQDGRDLWYFAYSDHSIVERSKFHGLSEDEAEQIASYVRSLQDSDASYSYTPPGRPFNPPFQPGPGLDALPAHMWAAGAGIDALLESESEMLDYVSLDDFSTNSLLSLRETPLSIQFPDWNEWLPDIHPYDMIGEDAFQATDMWTSYVTARQRLVDEGVAALAANSGNSRLDKVVTAHDSRVNTYLISGGGGAQPDWNTEEEEYEEFNRAFRHWAAVKDWELHREWDLEDEAHLVYGDYAEPRTWLGGVRTLFDLAPHISGLGQAFAWQDRLAGTYTSTVWYQAQQTVNAGNRVATQGQNPVDYNYHAPFITGVHAEGGAAHFVRLITSIAKMYELKDIPDADHEGSIHTPFANWYWVQDHPARIVMHGGYMDDPSDGLDAASVAALYDALLIAVMDRIEQIDPADWPRRVDTDGDGAYCDETSGSNGNLIQPASWDGDADPGGGHCSHDWTSPSVGFQGESSLSQKRFAEVWYGMVGEYRSLGVSESTLTRIIDYGEALWPSGDWDAQRADVPPDEDENQNVQLQLHGGWNTIALPVAPENADMAQVVGNVATLTMVKDINGGVFLPTHGIQSLNVWDPTKAYKVLVSDDATLQVSGTALQPSQTPIQLEAGWNLIPYFLETPQSIEVALAPILDEVQYMTDEEDGIFDPTSGTNTIGLLQPGRGYLIYLTQATTFTYPSN
jgi:cytochrome c553